MEILSKLGYCMILYDDGSEEECSWPDGNRKVKRGRREKLIGTFLESILVEREDVSLNRNGRWLLRIIKLLFTILT